MSKLYELVEEIRDILLALDARLSRVERKLGEVTDDYEIAVSMNDAAKKIPEVF